MSVAAKLRQKEARRFEDDLARDLGATRVFLSGAGTEKADVRKRARYARRLGTPMRLSTLTFRVEAKTTRRHYYAFRATDWWDLVRAADAAMEIPVFAVRFLGALTSTEVVLIRKGFANELGTGAVTAYPMRMDKSRQIRADDTHYRIGIDGTHEVLFLMSYSTFLEKLYDHPDFRSGTPRPDASQHR